MSSSHYKWLEETLGARQTGLGQRPATAGRRRRPVQGLTIGEAATIIQARVRLLRAQYKSVSVAGIGAAELRLHALLALQRSRRRRAEKARRAEGSDGGKLQRLRAATAATQNVRQKPAPLAKTLSSVRVGEEPDGALRFKGRVLSPPPKRASAQNGQLSPALIARLRERMAPNLNRPRTAPARRPPSPRAAAADRLAAQAAIVKALDRTKSTAQHIYQHGLPRLFAASGRRDATHRVKSGRWCSVTAAEHRVGSLDLASGRCSSATAAEHRDLDQLACFC